MILLDWKPHGGPVWLALDPGFTNKDKRKRWEALFFSGWASTQCNATWSCANPSFFRNHLGRLRAGLVANTLWTVWGRQSVTDPNHPCRHRQCAEKHSSAHALGSHQGWSTSVTPHCVYSSPFFVLHIQKMPWVVQLKWMMLRKCLFFPTSYQCHIPWFQECLCFSIKMGKFMLLSVVS